MKTCRVCERPAGHDAFCTPALRRLVRMAEKWEDAWSESDHNGFPLSMDIADESLANAARSWKKFKKEAK